MDPLNLERILLLAKILFFIDNEAVLLGDEIDCGLNILEEMNFPSGLSIEISKESLNLVKQVYLILSKHTEISTLLKLSHDDQALVCKSKIRNEILPLLVEKLIEEYPPFSFAYAEKLSGYATGSERLSIRQN